MKREVLDETSYQLYSITTDNFKNGAIDIVYSIPYDEKKIAKINMLSSLLRESSQKYPKRRLIAQVCEELFNANIDIYIWFCGTNIMLQASASVINQAYSNITNIKKVIQFMFELINNPNIINGCFDSTSFQINKTRILNKIERIKENPEALAFRKAFNHIDSDSFLAKSIYGTKDEVMAITNEDMVKFYEDFFNEAACKIFVIGDYDISVVNEEIKKCFKHKNLNDFTKAFPITIKPRNKKAVIVEKSKNTQSILLMFYRQKDLTTFEYRAVSKLFNTMFGGATLEAKLSKHLREENSLCYNVNSRLFHLGKLLAVSTGIAKENYKLAVSLVKKSLKEMCTGKFSDEELEAARKQIIFSYEFNYDAASGLLDAYEYNVIFGSPFIDEMISILKKVTREDIIKYAKKLDLVLTYFEEESSNE